MTPADDWAELEAALLPFATFVTPDPKWLADSDVVSMGSSMARKQLTAGDCRRAAKALKLIEAARQKEGGWQPIETAPLDTVILAAQYVIGDLWSIWQVRALPDGVVNAWTMEPMSFRDSPPLPFAPTHWRPLPPSPDPAASSEEM
jgi:hypothetical protein